MLPLVNINSATAQVSSSTPSLMAEGEILVKFIPGTPSNLKRSINSANEVTEKNFISALGVHVLSIKSGKSVDEMIALYQKNKNIEFVEPNYIATSDFVPNDTYYQTQQAAALNKMSLEQAWDITAGSSSVPVAILDTGASFNHPDLGGQYMSTGYDFVNNDSDPTDDAGHGTMVSGIIGAIANNGVGIAGASWNSKILPVKVLGSTGSGSYDSIANGITYAADHGVKVINMSLGGPKSSLTLKNAVDYAYNKGVVLVASAGNDNRVVSYPAAYPNVIAVAAVDNNDVKSTYSNFGSQIAVTAPGNNLTSTYFNGEYTTGSGTSFSAPFVASLAEMILSVDPSLTPAKVREAIISGAQDLGPTGFDKYYGNGRINFNNSLVYVKTNMQPVVDITAPVITLLGQSVVTIDTTSTYVDAGATATDNVDGDITFKIVDSLSTSPVDTATAGTYTVTYDVSDEALNQAVRVTRTVIVKEPQSTPTTDLPGSVLNKDTKTSPIEVYKDGTLTLDLSWSAARSNLDLYMYDSNNTLITSSKSSTKALSLETISLQALAGTYTVKIVSVTGAADYTLSIDCP